jgi:predicted transposase YbfD/YdcC
LDLFDIKGATVTIDAIGCQTETAKKMREKKGSYLLTVKDNHKTPDRDIKDYFEGLEQGSIRDLSEDLWITDEERKHGRVEQGEVRSVTDIDRLSGKANPKDLKTHIQYRSWRNGVMTDLYYSHLK